MRAAALAIATLTLLAMLDAHSAAAPAEPALHAPAPPTRSQVLLTGLAAADQRDVERAVAALEALPAAESTADLLFAAAHAAEDKLLDPARAAAIYDRIVAEHPDARVALAAARHAAALRPLVGPHGETAAQARAFSQLVASVDTDPPDAVLRRGDELAAAAWPGAPIAALWLADWLRRSGRLDDAQSRYALITTRWPALPQATAALRGGAGCAIDAHDWRLAETLANRLPVADDTDRSARDELLAGAARGRRRDRWHSRAWLAIAIAFATLLASLLEAVRRSPPATRRRALRPPIEIIFLAPVAAVLIGVAFTAHRLIAPAVAIITTGGLALAWLSGATLEQLRLAQRPRRLRSIAHVIACFAAVAGLGYVALAHGGLLDALIETVRFGPDS